MWSCIMKTLQCHASSLYTKDIFERGIIHVIGARELKGIRFHYAIHIVHNSRLINCLVMEFSI